MERFRDPIQNRLRRGVFRDVEELIMAIGDYIDKHNYNPSLGRLYRQAQLQSKPWFGLQQLPNILERSSVLTQPWMTANPCAALH
jgi:hypothetical protein